METVPKKPATIRDVARKAGVGLGTVSRVINDSPLVSEATRQRVRQTITELNYVPNPTARRLSLGRTMTVAAIAPFFTRPSITERLRGIENSLTESEYDLIIFNVETVARRDELIRDLPRRERVDGVFILSLSPRDEDVPILENADVPIVLIDANHPSLSSFHRVIVDDLSGGRIATQHLIDLGHRQIGFISDLLKNPFNFTSSQFRFQGYLQALEEAGIPFEPDNHGQGEHGRYEACRLATKMLSKSIRPTAIFAASDTQAMGVLEAARDLDLSVPEDLSVVGYDDIEVAEYLGLTTVRQLLFESGQRGVELLLKSFEKKLDEPVCDVLPIELIVRNTTAACSG
jgi:DNA-binding LacI/PurR family transcriptional regulator